MKKIPFTYLRGGTSRGIFFHEKDLPEDRREWNRLFLKVIGAPAAGAELSVMGPDFPTKKIAVISPSEPGRADVEYDFFQVDPEHGLVDNRGTCGNMASAVGPFAIDEGMVKPAEPESQVRIYNRNTKRLIISSVKVKNGRPLVSGNQHIPGVPGTGSPIRLDFENPGGGFSGSLFPTGNKTDVLSLPGYGQVRVTIIDCVNPIGILRAEEIGLSGREIKELDNMPETADKIETARCVAAWLLGLVPHWAEAKQTSTYIPHVAIVSPPQSYVSIEGKAVSAAEMDICCRAVFTKLHKTYPAGAAVATAAAAVTKGTVAADCFSAASAKEVLIGHPAGVMRVGVDTDKGEISRGTIVRTARRISDGILYL